MGAELLVNGGFDGASIAPWGTFGNLQSSCTFWLPSNTALATYSLTGFTTKAWPFTTVSIYPATTTNLPGPTTPRWLMLDSVSLTKTTMATGTTCVEPQ